MHECVRHLVVTLYAGRRVNRQVIVMVFVTSAMIMSYERRGSVMIGSHSTLPLKEVNEVIERLEHLADEWHSDPRHKVTVTRHPQVLLAS